MADLFRKVRLKSWWWRRCTCCNPELPKKVLNRKARAALKVQDMREQTAGMA